MHNSHVPSGRISPCLDTGAAKLRHLAGQPDRLEGRHRIRPQAHPGSNLFKRRCLLIDLGGQAHAGQGDGGLSPPIPPPIITIFDPIT